MELLQLLNTELIWCIWLANQLRNSTLCNMLFIGGIILVLQAIQINSEVLSGI